MQTLNEYFPDFLEQLKGQSASNRRNYCRRLQGFLALHGQKAAKDLTRAHVNTWLQLLKQKGYAEATRAGYQQALKTFLARACAAEGIVSPADHVRVESTISKVRKEPAEDDARAAFELAWSWLWLRWHSEEPNSAERRHILDACVYILSFETGARLGELVALKKSTVQNALRAVDDAGVYTVVSYGKRKEVDLEFTEISAIALRRWLEVRPALRLDRLFVTTRRSVTKADPEPSYRALRSDAMIDCFYRVCDAAKVPRHGAHGLRHRLGQLITAEYNAKLAAIKLNHADADTTAATAIAYYYKTHDREASRITAAMRPKVPDHEMAQLFGVGSALRPGDS